MDTNPSPEKTVTRPCWFVGACFDRNSDQTERFVTEGIWEQWTPRPFKANKVKSIQVGDRIAIKSSFTRKYDLPFDNHGLRISSMKIKAIGIVRFNYGDGHKLKVDWTRVDPHREWFFFTNQSSIWEVWPSDEKRRDLIDFTFNDAKQDYTKYCSMRGVGVEKLSEVEEDSPFKWVPFYEAVADKILEYRYKRSELAAIVNEVVQANIPNHLGQTYLWDRFANEESRPMEDICPFTAMGIFNRGLKDANRIAIATDFAKRLGVDVPVPDSFEGIPLLNLQKSWFYRFAFNRDENDIPKLWDVFAKGIALADQEDNSDYEELESAFVTAFDTALSVPGVKWNLTMGLYWSRPNYFLTLDDRSQSFIKDELDLVVEKSCPFKDVCSSDDYLDLMNKLKEYFQDEQYPVHSFPQLSLAAWEKVPAEQNVQALDAPHQEPLSEVEPVIADTETKQIEHYTVESIRDDGCFIGEDELNRMLMRLKLKKNLILQGPPGTGKTWLAKRLAYALMGEKDISHLKAVQFHPNISYEDFVRGWRPSGDGKLTLVDGPFMEMINKAKQDPNNDYVVVIEEINRGNPAQIFGEMLTLLEADKRNESEALALSYSKDPMERVYIPENLYVIGTMNIADRSLALVDLALRRRFAFIDLSPKLNEAWLSWVCEKCAMSVEIAERIRQRVIALNTVIAGDARLGVQYRIGHSFVTPTSEIDAAPVWFRHVVETEIGPLLEEYWYDDLNKARAQIDALLDGF